MKPMLFIIILLCTSVIFAQTKKNVFDENLTAERTKVIFERLDGSIFELNGNSNWTAHKVMPSSKDFSDFVKAKNPLIIEFETITGEQYSNTNGGNWKKTQKRFEPQGPMNVNARYMMQTKVIDVGFKVSNTTLVEINLHSVYGTENYLLHSKYELVGQHRIQLPLGDIPNGEYVLVLRTPQKAESVRLSISN